VLGLFDGGALGLDEGDEEGADLGWFDALGSGSDEGDDEGADPGWLDDEAIPFTSQ
jgi:hypothetical protein